VNSDGHRRLRSGLAQPDQVESSSTGEIDARLRFRIQLPQSQTRIGPRSQPARSGMLVRK